MRRRSSRRQGRNLTNMKILVDLRPALDGYSGIPQDARMLFSALAHSSGIETFGLLQSGNLVLEPGLTLCRDGLAPKATSSDQVIDRLSQVVVSMQQGPVWHRAVWARRRLLEFAGPLGAASKSLAGLATPLTAFDPQHFQDFVWRAMFAKSLPVSDFDVVMSRQYRVLRWPWSRLNQIGVVTAALGKAVYPRLQTRGMDCFIAQTPYPGRVARGTRLVVRYHDAIPLLLPHTVRNRGFHRSMHFHALLRNARDGAWFACDSEATRSDLLSVLPQLELRSAVIPPMVSHHFQLQTEGPERVADVIWARKNRAAPAQGGAAIDPAQLASGAPRYLLMVSTLEPRKNHEALIDAWELLRSRGFPDLHLVCVGSLGWDNEATLRRLEPWLERGGLHLLSGVPPQDLCLLYRHASATVCPSLSEGFDLTGAEAMSAGGVVAASDIRVHRDVYGDAAVYFNPYVATHMAEVLAALLRQSDGPDRAARQAAGLGVASHYKPEAVMPQWQVFLERVHGQPA